MAHAEALPASHAPRDSSTPWTWSKRLLWWIKILAMLGTSLVAMAGAANLIGIRWDVFTREEARQTFDAIHAEIRAGDDATKAEVRAGDAATRAEVREAIKESFDRNDRKLDRIYDVLLKSGGRKP